MSPNNFKYNIKNEHNGRAKAWRLDEAPESDATKNNHLHIKIGYYYSQVLLLNRTTFIGMTCYKIFNINFAEYPVTLDLEMIEIRKYKRNAKLLLTVLLLTSVNIHAQLDTSKSNFSFTGYTEVYYSYDLSQPDDHNRPSFFYSHSRHNEFNLNLGYVKASYNTQRVRTNLALAAGTYMNANYSAEPGVLKNIYEANTGIKLSKKKDLWVDAGIFSSHIGFESAVSKDCWGLTRSLLAENSPYYESGIKLIFISDSSKWLLSALILNGWQHIQRPAGNNIPALGTQVTFTPNAKISINYSTFIGNEKPDTVQQMRYFHNIYGMFHINDKFHITAGFDYGMEQKSKESSTYNNWYSPVLIVKVNFNSKWSVTARGEYYCDKNGVILSTGTKNGFQTSGYSLNFDYRIRENAVWRIEGRGLNSIDKIFTMNKKNSYENYFITTSLAIAF